jgi:hypothetical protein
MMEANQTIRIQFIPPRENPIGGWVGPVDGSAEMTYTLNMDNSGKLTNFLYIHNTTEHTFGYNGPGHGEREIGNSRIRIYLLYSL